MTRDEILNMSAGREIDIIVLRDILKYKPVYVQDGSLFGVVGELDCWYDEDGRFVSLGTSPSSDISTAWKVLEKMQIDCDGGSEPDYIMLICYKELKPSWYCAKIWSHHDGDIPEFEVTAETAPLAICRAALLAMVTA